MKVGDEWKGRVDYKFPTSEGYNEGTFRVEALETIDIPAGRFEAFRVVMRGFWTVPKIQSSTGRTGGLQEVTWYDRVSRRMLRRETIVRFDSSIKTVIFNREELMRTNVPSR